MPLIGRRCHRKSRQRTKRSSKLDYRRHVKSQEISVPLADFLLCSGVTEFAIIADSVYSISQISFRDPSCRLIRTHYQSSLRRLHPIGHTNAAHKYPNCPLQSPTRGTLNAQRKVSWPSSRPPGHVTTRYRTAQLTELETQRMRLQVCVNFDTRARRKLCAHCINLLRAAPPKTSRTGARRSLARAK